MVEVIQIHLFKNTYPFGLEKQGQTTFVQVFRSNLQPTQIADYRKNLQIFKKLKCPHIISLDSYVKEENSLHIYYKYHPQSLLSHLKRLSKQTINENIHQMCCKLANEINSAIECIIECLILSRIMADLSLQNVAVDQKLNLKMFVQPQIQILHQEQQNNFEVLKDYYETQRKKLHIQFQEQLQQLFGKKKQKQEINSPNFVINGTKLVFTKETNSKKAQNQQNTKANFKNQKFDINNILDKNKMQKNITQNAPHNQSSDSQDKKKNQRKVIQNYFNQDVNDNYTKDASFYPQQFTKEDTFADLQAVCYEQELQKELQQIKRKQKQKKQNIIRQQHTYNRQSFDSNLQKNKFSNSNQIKVKKQVSNNNTKGSIKNKTCGNNSHQYTTSSNQNSQDNSHNESYNSQRKKQKTNNNILNLNLKQEKRPQQQELQNSDQIKKKKYKMKIVTSHQVQIEDDGNIDIKDLQKQIIKDIKKGNVNKNLQEHRKNDEPKQSFNKTNNTNYTRFNQPISCKNIQNLQEKQKQRVLQRPSTSKAQDKINSHANHPFSKIHTNQAQSYQSYQSQYINQLKSNASQKHETKQDIAKIMQKIGRNIPNKNQQIINARQTLYTQMGKRQEERPASNVSNQPPSHTSQQQHEYMNKIQKAKSKAEQIMKIVKARKHNEQNE